MARAGEAYVDVGTLHGYRPAITLLHQSAERRGSLVSRVTFGVPLPPIVETFAPTPVPTKTPPLVNVFAPSSVTVKAPGLLKRSVSVVAAVCVLLAVTVV